MQITKATAHKTIKKLKDKKYRKQEGLFLVEGSKLCEEVLNSNYEIKYTITSNEFKYNDTLQLKISGLKDTTRKFADLYNTTYTLSDSQGVISSKKKAQVSDGRAKTNDSFIFRNKNNTSTPFMLAQFVNEVATGKFEYFRCIRGSNPRNW